MSPQRAFQVELLRPSFSRLLPRTRILGNQHYMWEQFLKFALYVAFPSRLAESANRNLDIESVE
jgi:hypothetical protein